MINKPAARPRGHAVARPLERGVRRHCGASNCDCLCKTQPQCGQCTANRYRGNLAALRLQRRRNYGHRSEQAFRRRRDRKTGSLARSFTPSVCLVARRFTHVARSASTCIRPRPLCGRCFCDVSSSHRSSDGRGGVAHVFDLAHEIQVRALCRLTFELSGRRRQDARPGLAKMYRVSPDRAWWPAVGAPLERRVRRHSLTNRQVRPYRQRPAGSPCSEGGCQRQEARRADTEHEAEA